MEFVQRHKFERLGVFPFSLESDTPAAELPGRVPDDVMLGRRDRLMDVQQQIAFEWNESRVGRTLDVLLDRPVEDADDVWIGRTYADAPDVDSVVYVTGAGLTAGQIVPCEIVTYREYDLVAAAVAAAY